MWLIARGDARHLPLKDNSVHCIVSSPPYWGLRDYRIEPSVWGGDAECVHDFMLEPLATEIGKGNWAQGMNGRGELQPGGTPAKRATMIEGVVQVGFCRCGAWLGCLGLEPTMQMFIEHLVEIGREAWRILRPDGTFWINLGDSYASGKGSCFNPGGGDTSLGKAKKEAGVHPLNRGNISSLRAQGLKPKDLCMMPARVVIALQDEGWYLRSRIIWHKENPMPSSTDDRPSVCDEDIYILTKRSRYFYDSFAVREAGKGFGIGTGGFRSKKYENNRAFDHSGETEQTGTHGHTFSGGRSLRTVWTMATQGFDMEICCRCKTVYTLAEHKAQKKIIVENVRHAICGACNEVGDWLSHFATFPEELPEKCIKAGTSEMGCCADCGAPYKRLVIKPNGIDPSTGENSRMYQERDTKPSHQPRKDRVKMPTGWQSGPGAHDTIPKGYYGRWSQAEEQDSGRRMADNTKAARDVGGEHNNPFPEPITVGWTKTCKCETWKRKPCVVVDMFSGAGTTALIADRLGRVGYGFDVSEFYPLMARRRIYEDVPLLNFAVEKEADDEPQLGL